MTARVAALLLSAGVLLAGCGSASGAGTLVPSQTPTTSVDPAVSASAAPDLVARAALAPCPASTQGAAPVAGGLPDLTLPCLGEGPSVHLSGLRRSPLVVNLWASWCAPCRSELPFFAALDAGDADVDVLGIDVEDPPDKALALLIDTGVHYPSVRDTGRSTQPALRWVGLPMTVLVGADGVIAHVERAPITSQAQLDGLVERYLGVPVPS